MMPPATDLEKSIGTEIGKAILSRVRTLRIDRGDAARSVLLTYGLAIIIRENDWADFRFGRDFWSILKLDLSDLIDRLLNISFDVEANFDDLKGVFTDVLIPDLKRIGRPALDLMECAKQIYDVYELQDGQIGIAFDDALNEINQFSLKGEPIISRNVEFLMACLSQPESGCTVFGLNCKTGSILAQAARLNRQANFYGIEANGLLSYIARLRLHFLGVRAQIQSLDALDERSILGDIRFDRVVCDVPYGMNIETNRLNKELGRNLPVLPSKADAFYVLLCSTLLKYDGRAVLLVPVSFLSRASEFEVRRYLLMKGLVEGVISLPAGAVTWTEISFAIVILINSGSTKRTPIFIDGDIYTIDRKRHNSGISEDCVTNIFKDYTALLQKSSNITATLQEIIDEGAVLRPKRWLSSSNEGLDTNFSELYAEARAAENEAASLLGRLDELSLFDASAIHK